MVGRRVLASIVLLVLAGCSRGSEPRPRSASPSVPLGAAPGTSSGFMTPGSLYESSNPCPRAKDPRIPSGSGCVFMVAGDLDGDRRPDAVFSYGALGADGRATSWFLRAVLASGGVSDLKLEAPNQLEVLGAADADGDGGDEVFVQLDHGASTSFLGIYALDRGRLVPVTEDGKAPLRFGLNGSVTHGDGGTCATGPDGQRRLVLRSVERTNEGPYEWAEKTYTWKGATVHLAGTQRGAIDAPEGADPKLQPFYEFTCGSLQLG